MCWYFNKLLIIQSSLDDSKMTIFIERQYFQCYPNINFKMAVLHLAAMQKTFGVN